MSGVSIFSLLVFIFLTIQVFTTGLPERLTAQLHYLYLIRVPLIGGLILFFLPIIAEWVAPQFLQNIFVVESESQLIIVIFFATVSAISIVSLIKSILVSINEKDKYKELNENDSFRVLRTVLTFAFFLPIWISLAFNSLIRNTDKSIGWGSFMIGTIISLSWLAVILLYDWRRRIPVINSIFEKITAFFKNWSNSRQTRRRSFLFWEIISIFIDLDLRRLLFFGFSAFIGLIIYGLAVYLNWPEPDGETILPENLQAPTLLYLLLIIWLLTLLMGALITI